VESQWMVAMSEQKVTRFSVSLPPSLVEELDEVCRDMGYESRSKAVHDAVRNFISEYRWMRQRKGTVTGAIVMLYYLDKPGLLGQLAATEHMFGNVISSVVHIHLDESKCLEALVVRGEVSEIRRLTQELTTKRGVKEVRFAVIAA
jgi:CopG family nickel-responsive transcriptional regulator